MVVIESGIGIDKDVNLVGGANLIVEGGGFGINEGTTAELHGLGITNAKPAISNRGVLTMTECGHAECGPLTADQRGEPRPEPGGMDCDVGRLEVQP
ncbi:MAG: hypothetical protein WBM75_11230 [Polyangiales bacterium]|jgi:hypothetical protein